MAIPTLIYCADGNKRLAEIAIAAGFKYGAQLPKTVYFPVYFADQNWKKPNRRAYMDALALHRPHIATALDWERLEQLDDVISWGEEASQHVNVVVIIPKVSGGVALLPKTINGKEVRLGYSVPTKYGGTQLYISEFSGWPVHLLGGSPRKQMEFSKYMDVVSADGNYAAKMALRYCEYWDGGWKELKKHLGYTKKDDAPYEAFHLSCRNIIDAWASTARVGGAS